MPEYHRTLRKLLQPGAGLVIPGAANALAARIVEASGFPVVYMTGAGVANSSFGGPDMGLVSVTEMVEHLGAMRDAVNVPIVADGDTGFGNALNVVRTVQLYERAGASAIQLEDQVFPKRCGHFENKEVITTNEMTQKIKAAVDSRKSEDFMIVARTDAAAVEGFERAIERLSAYREAGADALFLEAPGSVDQLRRIPLEVSGVHFANVVIGGKTPMVPSEQLATMGFAGILYANAALQASMQAMKSAMAHLRTTGSMLGLQDRLISFKDRQMMVDYARWANLEKIYSA